ncbi:response regulator [Cryomorphaceae bacterium]|nr:response regulator [Cryomorphaceae bacterium]
MKETEEGNQMAGLQNLANVSGFNYYILPLSPVESRLREVLSTMNRELHVWSNDTLNKNVVWFGALSEIQELLIQANPGDLVVIVASNADEVEEAFAEGADDVVLSPFEDRNMVMFEARWLRRSSGYDLTSQVTFDENGKVIRWNREFLLLTGYALEELRGLDFADLTKLDFQEQIDRQNQQANPAHSSRPMQWGVQSALRKEIQVLASTKMIGDDRSVELEVTLLDLNNRRQSRTYRTTQLLNDIARSSPIILTVYDLRLKRNTYQSRSLFASLGYTNEDIEAALRKGGGRSQFFHDDYLLAIDTYYEEILDLPDGEKKELIYRVRDKEGTWKWIRKISSVFYRDELGIPTQVLNSFENITEQKESESRIFETEARNRALIESVPSHIFRISATGKVIDFKVGQTELDIYNPKTKTRIGQEHLHKMNVMEMLPPKYLEEFQTKFKRALETGDQEFAEFDFNIEGQPRSFEVTLVRSAVDEIIVVINEVTDSRIKERLIQNRLNFVERINEISSKLIGVSIDRIDENINEVLEAVAEFTGVDRTYVYQLDDSGEHVDLTYEWTRAGVRPLGEVLPRAVAGPFVSFREKMERGENVIRTIDPERVKTYPELVQKITYALKTKSFANIPLLEQGHVYGFVGFDAVHDMKQFTQKEIEFFMFTSRLISSALLRKESEIKLIESREKAIEASTAKENFLSTMSHEIRTPLNAIIGMTHLLEKTELDGKQEEMVDVVKFSSDNLLNLINDILDFSKIESGKVELEIRNFSLKELGTSLRNAFLPKATEKRLNYEVICDERIPEFLMGDTTRLLQVLGNLISNAFKFTNEGEVVVEAKHLEETDKTVSIRFEVRDTGIGIHPDKHSEIFERFVQEDSSTTRNYGGTGLGLAIVRTLLLHMGSDIHLESNKDAGSVFYFELTFARGSETAEPLITEVAEFAEGDLEGKKILLVEDNILNQKVAERFLMNHGMVVTIAENGKMALQNMQDHSFDLVLMDLQMPVMDGLEAALQIRASQEEWREIPIIALTANANQSVEDQVLAAGMNDYITKPFDPELLKRKLMHWIYAEA